VGFDARITRRFAIMPYAGYVNTLGRLRVGRVERVVSNVTSASGSGFAKLEQVGPQHRLVG